MKTLILALIVCSAAARAEVYRCVDASGATQFSDRPCALGAQKLSRDPAPPGHGAANTPLDLVKQAQWEVDRLHGEIANFSSDYQARIGALDQRLAEAASHDEQNRIAREIAIETAKYRDELAIYQRELSRASRELAQAKSQAPPAAAP
jgi:Domain of unknown function (DUF4124)